jgi:hypothetical protein
MSILPVGYNSFVIHLVEDGQVKAYLIANGRVVATQIVAYVGDNHHTTNWQVPIALIKAFLAATAVIATILGQVEFARFIAQLLGVGA